ncbi:MAG: S8 family peptidase [Candidatus Yanofskybacteria bacterium]|nr:S8 family peptidase [Candidatus Yanofskybacteria bacterium]
MNTYKKLVFSVLLVAFLAFLPFWVSAEGSRYFVRSNKSFWKNALGVRHEFGDGFTTDASDFQLRLAKIFGVGVESVGVLQILPETAISLSAPVETGVPEDENGVLEIADEQPADSQSVTPEPTQVPAPKAVKGKGGTVRYIPSDQTPWGIEVVYDDPEVSVTAGGAGINVAVLDTGVNANHPDLKSRVSQCKDFTGSRVPVVDGKCDDKNGHGTHVAGIIAADAGIDNLGVYGVAPEADIFAYKVCGPSGSCYADDISVAIREAADRGANIINMSLGSNTSSSLIRSAVEYAASKGVLIVAAAGNDGPFPESIDYPAAYPEVIAVGAINQSFAVTDWSSRGSNSLTEPFVVEEKDIEFAAPGEYIESTWNNGSYVILSGTSMASPFVAGLAAKYWQSDMLDPLGDTRVLLHSLTIDLLPYGDDDSSGFGLPVVNF